MKKKSTIVCYDKYKDACCYMSPEELRKYVLNHRSEWSNINFIEMKEVVALFENDIYVLLNDGKLYNNDILILEDIESIWAMNISILFVITKDNYVYSLQDNIFNDYISNIKYKKIVKSGLDLLALTYDNKLKALTGYPMFIGIEPDNFIDVEDIFIEGELGTPYIIKNNIKIPLYYSEDNEEE